MSENGSGETRGPEMAAGGLRPSDVDFMPPLLRSLSSLCRLRGKALSPQFLLAGLSGSTVSAQACLRVARKAGLTGSVLYRPRLADLSNLTLPCILLLSGNRSCVLTRLVPGAPAGAEAGETGAETAQAEVIFPETESASQLVPLDALQEEYTGYALYVAVPGRPQEHVEKLRLAKGKRWFWDVLRYYAPIYRHQPHRSGQSPVRHERLRPGRAQQCHRDVVGPGFRCDHHLSVRLFAAGPAHALRGRGRAQCGHRALQQSGGQGPHHAAGKQAGIHGLAGQQLA